MSATFLPLEQNIGSISMNGTVSRELCRINIMTGVTTSSLLPSSWTDAIKDNVLKLIPYTAASERYGRGFLTLLMNVQDASGAHTPRLVPSRDPSTKALVVTLTATAGNETVLICIPRTTDAGFLMTPPSPEGVQETVDSDARIRLDTLESRVDILLGAGLDLASFLTQPNADLLYASIAHNHDGRYVKPSELPVIPKYLGTAADGVLATASGVDYNLSLSDTVPRLAAAVNPALTYSNTVSKALVLQSDGKYAPASVATPDNLTSKADKTEIVDYSAASTGGLSQTDTAASGNARAKREFSVGATVPRMANAITASQYDASMSKALVLNAQGLFDYVDVATTAELAAVQAGVDYKEAVVKTFTATPTNADISALNVGDRILVAIDPDTDKTSGIYVVPGTKTWAATSANRAADFGTTVHVRGAYIFDTGGGKSYLCTNADGADLPGTHPLTFVTYGQAVSYTFGAGLSANGTNVTAAFAGQGTSLVANGGGATGSLGTATTVARTDHQHPSDSTKADRASPNLTGLPTITYSQMPAASANSDVIATTAWVKSLGLATAAGTISAVSATGVTLNPNSVPPIAVPNGTTFIGAVNTSGSVAVTLYVGKTATSVASGVDTRFNVEPALANKGGLAYDNGGAWARLGSGSATNKYLGWDTVNGVPAWGSLTVPYDIAGMVAGVAPQSSRTFIYAAPRLLTIGVGGANGLHKGGVTKAPTATTTFDVKIYSSVANLIAGTAVTTLPNAAGTANAVTVNGMTLIVSTAGAVSFSLGKVNNADTAFQLPAGHILAVESQTAVNGTTDLFFTFAATSSAE